MFLSDPQYVLLFARMDPESERQIPHPEVHDVFSSYLGKILGAIFWTEPIFHLRASIPATS